jgi:hypothetical protein
VAKSVFLLVGQQEDFSTRLEGGLEVVQAIIDEEV